MDMKKYRKPHFINKDDVRDGPIEGRIAGVKDGKYDKPDLVLDDGNTLSLNATNLETLIAAYGTESDHWIAKQIKLFLGMLPYQNSEQEGVVVEPISPPVKAAKAAKKAVKMEDDWDDDVSEIPFGEPTK